MVITHLLTPSCYSRGLLWATSPSAEPMAGGPAAGAAGGAAEVAGAVPADQAPVVSFWDPFLGRGSKFSRRGYAGFGPCFHLPEFHIGIGFWLAGEVTTPF